MRGDARSERGGRAKGDDLPLLRSLVGEKVGEIAGTITRVDGAHHGRHGARRARGARWAGDGAGCLAVRDFGERARRRWDFVRDARRGAGEGGLLGEDVVPVRSAVACHDDGRGVQPDCRFSNVQRSTLIK